jgi:hypothetical protein
MAKFPSFSVRPSGCFGSTRIKRARKIPANFGHFVSETRDKPDIYELSCAHFDEAPMKSSEPELQQKLDELADGLDAGWDELDEPPMSLSASPHSAPLPASLDEVDAEWDSVAPPPPEQAVGAPARAAQVRPNALRPSQARPSPVRALTPAAAPGAPPLRVSKRERREAERKRRAHEAQLKLERKKERKAVRREEARRASEQSSLAEQQAQAEREARAKSERKAQRRAPAAKAEGERGAARVAKKTRREAAGEVRSVKAEPALAKAKPAPIAQGEAWWKKLLVPLAIGLLFGATLWFALSRAR